MFTEIFGQFESRKRRVSLKRMMASFLSHAWMFWVFKPDDKRATKKTSLLGRIVTQSRFSRVQTVLSGRLELRLLPVTPPLTPLSNVSTAASGDGELDMFLRKGRRRGAITLPLSLHVSLSLPSPPAALISCAEDVSALDRCLLPLVWGPQHELLSSANSN